MNDTARERVLVHGWNSTCYQILNPGFSYWFSSVPEAVVGYVDYGGYRIVGGAPVCASADLPEIVRSFEADARSQHRRVAYFCAEGRLHDLLVQDAEHAAVVLGAQPVWHPAQWPTIVAGHASVRAQIQRAKNKRVHIDEWPPAVAENHDTLRACLADWLGTRGLPPLHFLIEPDTLSFLNDRRCFVASVDRHVVGFLILTPVPRRNGWLVEQLVRRTDAPNGTSAALLNAAFETARTEGAGYLTLGLAPLASRAPGAGTTNPLWLRVLRTWARAHGRRFYNFRGLEAFKAKFDPQDWDPVYLIVDSGHISIKAVRATAGAFAQGAPEGLLLKALGRAMQTELRRLRQRLHVL